MSHHKISFYKGTVIFNDNNYNGVSKINIKVVNKRIVKAIQIVMRDF